MMAVAIQPRTIRVFEAVKSPITFFFEARMMITAIKGTATTPLMTALQNRAFIGLIGEYWITSPRRTLTAMTP